jgi:FkbM family methyltransferase
MWVVLPIERLIRRAGGVKRVSTVFVVGAYDGADSLPLAERYRHTNIRFVAIEPTPDLAEALRQKSAHLPNYTVVEAAVASEEGRRVLHVFADHQDLNSLNRFRESAASSLPLGRESAEPDAGYVVSTKRLSTICDELDIKTIDVLHIDTQGSDLDVLRSLDESRLLSVRAGAIEVSYRVRLYDVSKDGRQTTATLQQMGFRVFRIERVYHRWDGELNCYFARRRSLRASRLARVAFRSHLIACEARVILGRYVLHPVQRLRVTLGVRTRLKRLIHPQV